MTTTNQAFIKAYRHDAAEVAAANPAIAGAEPSASAVNVSAGSASVAMSERSALYGPRPTTTAGVNDPKLPSHPAPAATEKQPLSSFIARPLKAALQAPAADADLLRPGTTIASFLWPPICRALAQQCELQLDDVAELILREAQEGRSLIGIVGMAPGRGTTTLALCVAARLARRGRRLILVDGNFCSPRLASWLEAVPTTGWQEVLKHGGPLADAVIRATDDRFDLLALDARKPDKALKLVGGLQAVVTAGVLRHGYDVVLVDVGAFFDPTSQPIVIELIRNMGLDAVLAVTGPEPADTRDLGILAGHLSRSGCELLGTIANRVAKPQAA